jgi:hypothetical protein
LLIKFGLKTLQPHFRLINFYCFLTGSALVADSLRTSIPLLFSLLNDKNANSTNTTLFVNVQHRPLITRAVVTVTLFRLLINAIENLLVYKNM